MFLWREETDTCSEAPASEHTAFEAPMDDKRPGALSKNIRCSTTFAAVLTFQKFRGTAVPSRRSGSDTVSIVQEDWHRFTFALAFRDFPAP